MKTYELYYIDGGHGGPFYDIGKAREHAERMIAGSSGRTKRIEIRPDSSKELGGYGYRNGGSYYIEQGDPVMLCIA